MRPTVLVVAAVLSTITAAAAVLAQPQASPTTAIPGVQQAPGPRSAQPGPRLRDTGGRPPAAPAGTSTLTGPRHYLRRATGRRRPRHGRRRGAVADGDDRCARPVQPHGTARRPLLRDGVEARIREHHLRPAARELAGYAGAAGRRRDARHQHPAATRRRDHRHGPRRARRAGGQRLRAGHALHPGRGRAPANAGRRRQHRRSRHLPGALAAARRLLRLRHLPWLRSAERRAADPAADRQRPPHDGNATSAGARQQMATRLADLQAQMPAQTEPATGYASVCFPGSSLTASTMVPVSVGEEKGGVDLQLQLTPVARVEGMLVAPPGRRAAQRSGAWQTTTSRTPIDRNFAQVDEPGEFVFQSVPPGRYTIVARSMPGNHGPPGPLALLPAAAPPVGERQYRRRRSGHQRPRAGAAARRDAHRPGRVPGHLDAAAGGSSPG